MAHILIPTDFSMNALNAAAYALDLYGHEGNTFTLMNCYMIPHHGSSAMDLIDPNTPNLSEQGLSAFMDDILTKRPDCEYRIEMESESGELAHVIGTFKERPDPPDVVVMGTQGATGMKEVLMGSNTSAVIKRSGIPVLAVPEDAVYRSPKRVLLADDGKPVEPGAMKALLDIVERASAEVIVLRIIDGTAPVSTPGSSGSFFAKFLEHIPHTYVHQSGDAMLEILDEQVGVNKADLIAVMHRPLGWVEGLYKRSMSAKLAMHAHTPLLVLQQNAGS